MAIGKKTGGRDFKPGHPGRPKGAKDKVPRGIVKKLVLEAVEDPQTRQKAVDTLKANLAKTGRVKEVLELAAKLNQEIGIESVEAPPPVIINFNSPVNPKRLREGLEKRERKGGPSRGK